MGGRLEGKVAVITGGCSGIGLATAERYMAEGAKVAIGDIQDEKGASLASGYGPNLIYVRCDVTDVQAIKTLIDTAADHFGGLDILFNNAGAGGGLGSIEELSMEVWDWTFDLLVRSVAAGTKFAIPYLEARGGGSIINTASVAGIQAGWGPIAYSTAKAAVIHFSKLAAMEGAQRKIRVNAICPGLIATSIFGRSVGLDTAVADQLAGRIADEFGPYMQALPTAGTPDAIANTALFLASDESFFVTGQHFVVDGGLTSGYPHSWQQSVSMNPVLQLLGLTEEEVQQRMDEFRAQQEADAKSRS